MSAIQLHLRCLPFKRILGISFIDSLDFIVAAITNKNIREFRSILLKWFRKSGRKFHWRNKGLTNYQLVIAETLLQRTKAETVSKFYKDFLNTFPNWLSLATSNRKKLESYLIPIGLYRQRATRLQNLATEMQKRSGRFPKDRAELESIPFLGQYIANSIELLIFKKPLPLIDVNMARVLERYFGKRNLSDIRYDPYLQNLAVRIVDSPKAKELNWSILDFAALVCRARNPLCPECPLNRKCTAFRTKQFS
jgi:A/G-specific adenine glycosylase